MGMGIGIGIGIGMGIGIGIGIGMGIRIGIGIGIRIGMGIRPRSRSPSHLPSPKPEGLPPPSPYSIPIRGRSSRSGWCDCPGARAVAEARDTGVIAVVEVADREAAAALEELVDQGEAHAMALAIERGIKRLLMDDLAGRHLAQARGLTPIGPLGVLVNARREGLVEDIAPLLDALDEAGLRMTPGLRRRVEELASDQDRPHQ